MASSAPQHPAGGAARAVPWAVAAAVVITVAVATAYEAYAGQVAGPALVAVAGFYLATAGTVMGFAVWTAGDLQLPSLLVLAPLSAGERWRRILVWGVAMGVVLAVASVLLAGAGGPALRPWYWQRIQTLAGTTLFAARGALLEEAFFRLFLIPFLVSMVVRARAPRYRVRLREGRASIRQDPRQPGVWVVPAAVLLSSLLFGLAHPGNPLAAMTLAPGLAVAYLRGGWESAALAHFLANWLVFTIYF